MPPSPTDEPIATSATGNSAPVGKAKTGALPSCRWTSETQAPRATASATAPAKVPTAMKCSGIPTPTFTATQPVAAPSPAPRLQTAWNTGMIGRFATRSTSPAQAFIVTSIAPCIAPNSSSAAASSPTLGASATSHTAARCTAASTNVTRAAPSWSDQRPASGNEVTAPSPIASSTSPSAPGSSPNFSATAGTRLAQVPKNAPFSANIAATARKPLRLSFITAPTCPVVRGLSPAPRPHR